MSPENTLLITNRPSRKIIGPFDQTWAQINGQHQLVLRETGTSKYNPSKPIGWKQLRGAHESQEVDAEVTNRVTRRKLLQVVIAAGMAVAALGPVMLSKGGVPATEAVEPPVNGQINNPEPVRSIEEKEKEMPNRLAELEQHIKAYIEMDYGARETKPFPKWNIIPTEYVRVIASARDGLRVTDFPGEYGRRIKRDDANPQDGYYQAMKSGEQSKNFVSHFIKVFDGNAQEVWAVLDLVDDARALTGKEMRVVRVYTEKEVDPTTKEFGWDLAVIQDERGQHSPREYFNLSNKRVTIWI